MLLTHALALSAINNRFLCARKSLYEYVHSVRIELAKLILVGTRIAYQATGYNIQHTVQVAMPES